MYAAPTRQAAGVSQGAWAASMAMRTRGAEPAHRMGAWPALTGPFRRRPDAIRCAKQAATKWAEPSTAHAGVRAATGTGSAPEPGSPPHVGR